MAICHLEWRADPTTSTVLAADSHYTTFYRGMVELLVSYYICNTLLIGILGMGNEERTELLKSIRDEILAGKNLPLYAERKKNNVFPVIGEGSHTACIMFVGEAPGKNEAATGRPFCGASGRILDELLASVHIERGDVYITNIVKDRPPMNRDPLPEEIIAYAPFLDRQINIIEPRVIATLGRFSMRYIMEKFNLGAQLASISAIHGTMFEAEASYGPIKILPLYHPAVALYGSSKDELKKDFQVLAQFTSVS
jgi:DNA polymerase